MARLRVHRDTYEFWINHLQEQVNSGSPSEVCSAARALVENCFTRRSFLEWGIDHAPDWIMEKVANRESPLLHSCAAQYEPPVNELPAIALEPQSKASPH